MLLLMLLCLVAILLLYGIVLRVVLRAIAVIVADREHQRSVRIGAISILTSILGWFFLASVYYIEPDEVGVVVARVNWNEMPSHRALATESEQGRQARLLAPGYNFLLFPLIFEVEISPHQTVMADRIAFLEALDGLEYPPDLKDVSVPDGCPAWTASAHDVPSNMQVKLSPVRWLADSWYEPTVFLRCGFQGIQITPLSPGPYRLHPQLFRIIEIDTSAQVLKFFGEPSDDRPGLSSITVAPRGLATRLNLYVSYMIKPQDGPLLLGSLGTTDPMKKAQEKVVSEIRAVVDRLSSQESLEALLTERERLEARILKTSVDLLSPYGVTLSSVSITSVFAPSDTHEKAAFEAARTGLNDAETFATKQRALQAELKAIQDEVDRNRAASERDLRQAADSFRSLAEEIGLDERSPELLKVAADRARTSHLVAALGKEYASVLLIADGQSRAGLPIVPSTLVGLHDNLGDRLLSLLSLGRIPAPKGEPEKPTEQ